MATFLTTPWTNRRLISMLPYIEHYNKLMIFTSGVYRKIPKTI